MRRVQASVARTKFGELLDEVERGETVVITRRGEAVARIVPEEGARRRRVEKAFRIFGEVRKRTKPATAAEIRAWIDEGRM